MTDEQRAAADARKEEAELRFPDSKKKKRKFLPDNVPDNVLWTVQLLAEFLGEHADELEKFVERKRPHIEDVSADALV